MIKSFNNTIKFVSITAKNLRFMHSALNFSKQQQNIAHDTIFIRHAHSEFNKACQDYRTKFNIEYDWDSLCQHPGFQNAVAYNPQYLDCNLTSQGIQQCYLTSHKINLKDIDVIMVSPHQRTLETCANIFKFSKSKINIPVIVEPLVAGSLWSSCDVSKNIVEKKKQFSFFDFSRMLNYPELWFIQNLETPYKRKVYSEIQRLKLTNFKDKQLLVLDMLKSKSIKQDRKILRQRAWDIKKLMKKVKQNHFKMLIISHYYIIQYVNARSFNQANHLPMQDVDLKNCHPYYNTLDQLLNNGK